MEGKRVLITGGNSGIGLVAAKALAALGAEIVLACRESEKTEKALDAISGAGNGRTANIPVDLASLESVRRMAQTFLDTYDRLDVLINNAGLFPPKQHLTQDGFEMQIGVNHLSHFLLTNLLLDRLKESAPARIVTVSSALHKRGEIDFDSFRGFDPYSAQTAYNQSKLANALFAVELAKRLEGTGVTSNTLHPGAVRTEIARDLPWYMKLMVRLTFIPAEKGAETTIMLASDPSLAETTGQYFDQCKTADPSPFTTDAALREKLWDESLKAVALA